MKRSIILCCFLLITLSGYVQTHPADTIPPVIDQSLAMDTSFDYDDIMSDLESFIDSLLAPRSYGLVNLSLSSNYYNFSNATNTKLDVRKKTIFSPTLGYYHKSGAGLTLSGNMINDGNSNNLYQYSISPSFDFIQNREWIGGFYYTKYITKDSLNFYTTPLQNEVGGYFLWRKSWVQPGIAVSYGWGSRTDLEKRIRYINLLRRRRRIPILTVTSKEETAADFSMTASARHNFYWRRVIASKDYIKFTPLLTFSAGTQKFGLNQGTNVYAPILRNSGTGQFSYGEVKADDKLKFQPLSLTLYLQTEYAIGKFFIQPQFILEYYFPDGNKSITSFFSLNAGLLF